MKIFYYDKDTGIFQGEDFTDVGFTRGQAAGIVPSGATTVEPPPYAHGQVPFFDRRSGRWQIRTLHRGAKGTGSDVAPQPDPNRYGNPARTDVAAFGTGQGIPKLQEMVNLIPATPDESDPHRTGMVAHFPEAPRAVHPESRPGTDSGKPSLTLEK